MSNIIIRKGEYKGFPVVIIENDDPARPESFTFGRAKARKLIEALSDDNCTRFLDILHEVADVKDDAETVSKTVDHEGKTYGLFKDGSIKVKRTRQGKDYWAALTGEMKDVLKPEHFDGTPIPSAEKASKGGNGANAALLATIAQQQALMKLMAAKLGVELPA